MGINKIQPKIEPMKPKIQAHIGAENPSIEQEAQLMQKIKQNTFKQRTHRARHVKITPSTIGDWFNLAKMKQGQKVNNYG